MKSTPLVKDFPVFDCDSHIHEPGTIWTDYLEPQYRDICRRSFWKQDEADGSFTVTINGQPAAHRRGQGAVFSSIRSPAVDRRTVRNLRQGIDPCPIVRGSYDPHARLTDMDAMGIDQVMIFGTIILNGITSLASPVAAKGIARAYNNWVRNYTQADPKRLFAAAVIPQHDNQDAIAEIRRCAEMGFKCVTIRPNIVAGRYPTHPSFDEIWKTISDLGLVAALHPFPGVQTSRNKGSTGVMLEEIREASECPVYIAESLAFAHDSQAMLMTMFHHDFFDKHRDLKFSIMEANAAWLPYILDKADGRVVIYEATRGTKVRGKPSEVWYRGNNWISFESDEATVFELWKRFRSVGIWASDYPHFDSEDAWEALEHMQEYGVPKEAVTRMMGSNALDMFGIAPGLAVKQQATTSA